MKTEYADLTAYVTKDGSIIRELMHPAHHPVANQSLAEATVPPGTATFTHRHDATEELYHFTAGSGVMRLGDEQFAVAAGDTVPIPPGTVHNVRNCGEDDLVILCCCSPAYSHDDTILAEDPS